MVNVTEQTKQILGRSWSVFNARRDRNALAIHVGSGVTIGTLKHLARKLDVDPGSVKVMGSQIYGAVLIHAPVDEERWNMLLELQKMRKEVAI